MRLMTKMSLITVAVIALTACQKEAKETEVKLDTEQAKQSYSVGVSTGRYLDSTIAEYNKMEVPLDKELILRGLQDALADKAVVTESEIETALVALDQKFRDKQAAVAEAEAQAAQSEGKVYLEKNASKEGVTVTESGLQYEVVTAGTGAKPTAQDVVKVHYTGTLIDGTKFDSSHDRGEPAQFPLNRVIPGWTEGVQLMNVGSKFRFVIPSELAYGERDMGTIKPHSVLVFEVELLDIVAAEE